MPRRATSRRLIADYKPRRFDQRLVLNQWMISLFQTDFEKLVEQLKEPENEGFEEDNTSRFYHVLASRLIHSEHLPPDVLLGYDENIVRHWRTVMEGHEKAAGRRLYPKHFQYLSLLFTEIYLDRYFRDPDTLLADLNAYVAQFNDHLAQLNQEKAQADMIELYQPDQLNKLAFWNATGSGKTHIMHVNLLQYQHYLKLHGKERELNRIILLTP